MTNLIELKRYAKTAAVVDATIVSQRRGNVNSKAGELPIGVLFHAFDDVLSISSRVRMILRIFQIMIPMPNRHKPDSTRNTRLGGMWNMLAANQYTPAPNKMVTKDRAFAVPRKRPRSPSGESF